MTDINPKQFPVGCTVEITKYISGGPMIGSQHRVTGYGYSGPSHTPSRRPAPARVWLGKWLMEAHEVCRVDDAKLEGTNKMTIKKAFFHNIKPEGHFIPKWKTFGPKELRLILDDGLEPELFEETRLLYLRVEDTAVYVEDKNGDEYCFDINLLESVEQVDPFEVHYKLISEDEDAPLHENFEGTEIWGYDNILEISSGIDQSNLLVSPNHAYELSSFITNWLDSIKYEKPTLQSPPHFEVTKEENEPSEAWELATLNKELRSKNSNLEYNLKYANERIDDLEKTIQFNKDLEKDLKKTISEWIGNWRKEAEFRSEAQLKIKELKEAEESALKEPPKKLRRVAGKLYPKKEESQKLPIHSLKESRERYIEENWGNFVNWGEHSETEAGHHAGDRFDLVMLICLELGASKTEGAFEEHDRQYDKWLENHWKQFRRSTNTEARRCAQKYYVENVLPNMKKNLKKSEEKEDEKEEDDVEDLTRLISEFQEIGKDFEAWLVTQWDYFKATHENGRYIERTNTEARRCAQKYYVENVLPNIKDKYKEVFGTEAIRPKGMPVGKTEFIEETPKKSNYWVKTELIHEGIKHEIGDWVKTELIHEGIEHEIGDVEQKESSEQSLDSISKLLKENHS